MKKWWIGSAVLGVVGAAIVLWVLFRPAAPGSDPGAPTGTAPARSGAGAAPGPAEEAATVPPGARTAEPLPTQGIFPHGEQKARHWFLQLGPEGMGLSRTEWTRLRMTTPHLGVPKAGENPVMLPGFDYVTVTNPVGETSEDNGKRVQQLLEEARRQKLHTMAHLMGQSRGLDPLEKGGGRQPLEFLIPVPPNTRVDPPLVVRHMPDLRVWAMTSGVPGAELGKAVQALVEEARGKGFRVVAPVLGRYEGEDWLEAVEKGRGEAIRVYLVVEGGG
ncbi:MAG TPA: hypothetical protein PLQ97_05010 [Myxococcota bacterium]|nr:hypothetical protein [Myxococcota bacterium]HQK51605.1 hypothetical protein [Myxococcota bacterium]